MNLFIRESSFSILSFIPLINRSVSRLFRFVAVCCLIGPVLLSNKVSNCVFFFRSQGPRCDHRQLPGKQRRRLRARRRTDPGSRCCRRRRRVTAAAAAAAEGAWRGKGGGVSVASRARRVAAATRCCCGGGCSSSSSSARHAPRSSMGL
jgi:hypothetical protein